MAIGNRTVGTLAATTPHELIQDAFHTTLLSLVAWHCADEFLQGHKFVHSTPQRLLFSLVVIVAKGVRHQNYPAKNPAQYSHMAELIS